MNRGIARRTAFESRRDVRCLLALLASEARARRVAVHAFSILTTHYHLLLSTPDGDISGVMRRVGNQYVRNFNRSRHRDGPLFRGRFTSRPVTSHRYRFTVMRYIDQNAVEARLVSDARHYPYGSAIHYGSSRRPRWMDTRWVDWHLETRRLDALPHTYMGAFGTPLRHEERALVEARIRAPAALEDELDDLVGAAPSRVREWMHRKAMLADHTKPGHPVVAVSTILDVLRREEEAGGSWRCMPATNSVDALPIIRAGLLRDLAGASYQFIARTLDLPQSSSQRRAKQHRVLMENDPEYAARAAELASRCLQSLGNP